MVHQRAKLCSQKHFNCESVKTLSCRDEVPASAPSVLGYVPCVGDVSGKYGKVLAV